MERFLSHWPTLAELARDLGLPYQTVASWRQRGRIPADYDLDLIRAAAARGGTITLAELAEARRLARVSDAQRGAA